MGSAISTATNGVGDLLGNAFMAPLKSIFGHSCEGVCSGPWDVLCFIEHLCVSNILRLLMILVLCYITLLFFYILFKLGLCQCVGKSLCRMCWAACEMYWFALEDITCFLWHKLLSTERVNRRRRRRRRFRDVEQGYAYSSSDEAGFSRDNSRRSIGGVTMDEESAKRRRGARIHNSFRASRYRSRGKPRSRGVSVRVKGGSRGSRSGRRLRLSKSRNVRRDKGKTFKRRRLK